MNLLDYRLDQVDMGLHFPRLHNSNTHRVNDHSSFFLHVVFHLIQRLGSTSARSHLWSCWIWNQVNSDVVIFKLLVDLDLLCWQESGFLWVLLDQNCAFWIAELQEGHEAKPGQGPTTNGISISCLPAPLAVIVPGLWRSPLISQWASNATQVSFK